MAKYVKKKKSKDPSYKKKPSKYYPVLREMELGDTSGAPQVNTIVEIPKLLSVTNQRLYRQHGSYRVKVELNAANADAVAPIDVYALAPTWWVINSIKQAKAHFDKAMKDETQQTKPARWYDFRIDHNSTTATSAGAFLGINTATTTSSAGVPDEYVYSDVRCSDGNDRVFSLAGATSTSQYNIFTEYDRMGASSMEPRVTVNGGYDDLIDDIDAENTQHLTDSGNRPPYDGANFPSVMWVKVGTLYYDNDGSQRVSTGFFEAPLGYIWLPGYSLATAAIAPLSIECAKGGYKGVDFTAY